MTFKTLTIGCILAAGVHAATLPGPGTETVHSVAHVKAGHEAQYLKASAEAWTIYKKLGLVLDSPHVVLRGTDQKGRPMFVEIFTWKSPDIPDHAPAEVKAVWQELEEACEVRDGRPGIDFSEVTAIALE